MGWMKDKSSSKPSWALAVLLVPVLLLTVTSRGASSSHSHRCRPSSTDLLQGLQTAAEFLCSEEAHVLLLALLGSIAVGLSGIFPLLIIPIEAGAALKTEAGSQRLKQLLSFAIGGLLGDVFLHLLPEAWALSASVGKQNHYTTQGLWVIAGLLAFLLLEKMFPDENSHEGATTHADLNFNSKQSISVFSGKTEVSLQNGHQTDSWKSSKQKSLQQTSQKIKTSGYLNLLANCIDNFTHGLAVGGSFLVSKKVGLLTTFAILLHEIPHEVGDFAILLRAGFDRWSAARMQLSTAMVGVLGACAALYAQKGTEDTASWILPFTSGGFLYIALVNVVPDLLQESNLRYFSNIVYVLSLVFCHCFRKCYVGKKM
ncbi:hypothetical protein WMY93_013428 [Mugilogobius chulae]|uniref:Zinc transporter ZIP13 n=1 Tax=Mugilogobius chulae TaxID=88201 RepID=A0AAW0P934_9GOBI